MVQNTSINLLGLVLGFFCWFYFFVCVCVVVSQSFFSLLLEVSIFIVCGDFSKIHLTVLCF